MRIFITRIFGALTGPKILAWTAPIKVGSAHLVLVDLVACFQFLSAAVSQQRLYKFVSEKHNSISVDEHKCRRSVQSVYNLSKILKIVRESI